MKQSKFSEQQIAFTPRQAEEGTSVEEVCRKAAISQQTYYIYGRMWTPPSDASSFRSGRFGMWVVCAETRQLKAVLSATVNKSDRNDARGIAQMLRVNMIRPVHVKTVSSQEKRMLLTNRKFMLKQLCDTESHIRGTLRNFGLKVGQVSRGRFETRIRELVEDRAALTCLVQPLLRARAELLTAFNELHSMMLHQVRADPVCRRLMTVPGVGPVTALTFRATVDVPARFSPFSLGRCPLRSDATQMAIRGDRSHGSDLQMRRCDDANGTLRRRPQYAHTNDAVVVVEGVGHASGETPWPGAGEGCARSPPRRDHAPHVDGWQRVPVEPRQRRRCGRRLRANANGKETSTESESFRSGGGCPRGDEG